MRLIACLLLLAGCGRGPTGPAGKDGSTLVSDRYCTQDLYWADDPAPGANPSEYGPGQAEYEIYGFADGSTMATCRTGDGSWLQWHQPGQTDNLCTLNLGGSTLKFALVPGYQAVVVTYNSPGVAQDGYHWTMMCSEK